MSEEYDFSSISECCDPWDYREEVVGNCPDCGEPIDSDGEAVVGCLLAAQVCSTCGSRPCCGYCQ